MLPSLGKNTTQVTYLVGGALTSSPNLTRTSFVGGDSKVRQALKDAQLGKIDGNKILSGLPGPDIRIARQGRSGLLNLTSFCKASRPPVDPPAPNRGQPATGVQQSIAGHDAPFRGKAVHSAIYRKAEASKAVRTVLQEREPEDDQGREELHYKKVAAMANALRLAMPELQPPGPPSDMETNGPLDADIEHMASRLGVLDREMRAGAELVGDTKYDTEKLISVLLGFGRTAELARSPFDDQRSLAVASMTALIDTLIEAIEPPRDGSALNSLVGKDAELDGAIRGLRIKATKELMVASHAGEPSQDEMELIAREVVDSDMALAKMRSQVHLALGGGYEFSGMTGLRVDTALVKGLREKLGASATEVGLIVAGLTLAETEALRLTDNDGKLLPAGRLLGAVVTQLETWRKVVAQMRRDHAEALTERSEAGQQLSLQRKWVAECDAQLGKAIDQGKSGQEVSRLINLRGDALDKIPRLENRLRELDDQLTRLNEAEQHVRFLEERRLSLTPEREMIKERRDAAEVSVRALETKHKQVVSRYTPELEELKEKARRLDAFRSTLQAGPRRDKIMMVLDAFATRQVEIEEELLAAERRLKFAQKNLWYWEGLSSRDKRYAEVAAVGGLAEDELKKLGFKPYEAEEALKTARQLARQGLRSAEQVDRIVRDVNAVMSKLSSRRFGIDDAVEAQSDALAGATNEVKAKNLGDTLLRSLRMSDDGVAATIADALEHKLGPSRPAAVVAPTAAEPQECSKLDTLGMQFRGFQNDMVASIEWGRELDRDHGTMVARIEQFSSKQGLGWDAEHPPGLSVSRTLLEAVGICESYTDGVDGAPAPDRVRFRHLAKALAGFNPKQISVPFFQFNKDALTEEEIDGYGKNVPLRQAAEAIVFLREIEPRGRAALNQAISAAALRLDEILDDRRQEMGPDTFRVVRDTIRAAILDVMPNTPGAVTSFNPADHAQEIREKLASWGFPVDRFEPEVTMLLSQSFGPAELEIWVASTKLSDELVQKQDAKRQKRVEALAGESQQGGRVGGISSKTKEQLLSQVDQMQPGTWVVLAAGDRVEIQTGYMPIEPSTIGSLNVKAAVGKMGSLEVGRGINSYELVLLDGGDGRLTSELSARLFRDELAPLVSLNVGATVTLEGTAYRVTGVSITTPNNPEGCKAIKDILTSLLTEGRIKPSHLARADNIMPVVEWAGGVRAGGRVSASVGVKPAQWQDGSFEGSGFSFGVDDVGAYGRYSHTGYSSANANMTIEKLDREVTVTLSAGAVASVALAAPINNINDTPHTAATDPLAAVGSTTFAYKIRSNEVRGPDGLVLATTTKQRQVMAPSKTKEAIVSRMGGDLYQRVIAGMPAEARESIRTLINASGPGDMINIGYALDERIRTEANNLLKEAQGLRSGTIPSASREAAARRILELENQAQSLLDDNDSYIPFKVQLVPTTETQGQTLLNLVFVNSSTYTRSKSESVAAEVKLDVALGMDLRARGLQQRQTLLDAPPSSR
jgi:hypothetical protein